MARTGRHRSRTACCKRWTVSGEKCISPVSTLTRAGTFSTTTNRPPNSMWYVTVFSTSVSFHVRSSGIGLYRICEELPFRARHSVFLLTAVVQRLPEKGGNKPGNTERLASICCMTATLQTTGMGRGNQETSRSAGSNSAVPATSDMVFFIIRRFSYWRDYHGGAVQRHPAITPPLRGSRRSRADP